MIIIAIVHQPDILILDEPFSGLDPVNRELVKNIILDLKKKGITIIMSTHQMDEVERMCDRILMINRGNQVLYPKIAGVEKIDDYGNHAELVLKKGTDTQKVLKRLVSKVEIKRFEIKTHSLNEIFISVVQDE